MQFEPTPDQEAFIERAIASGRYRNAEEAMQDAMAQWEEDERTRMELLTAFDKAEGDLAYADYSDETRKGWFTPPMLSTQNMPIYGRMNGRRKYLL